MYDIFNQKLCNNLNRIKLDILLFGHAMVEKEWTGKVIYPDFTRLYYIEDGISCITLESGEKIFLKPGNWYLLPTNCSFKYECKHHLKHIYFHIKLCDFDGIDLLSAFKTPICYGAANNKSEFLKSCINSDNITDALAIRQIIYEILISLITTHNIPIKSDDYSPCVLKALRYIKENLSAKLTVLEIAENAYVAKSTLEKHFKKELGVSINAYINNNIMSQASQLLISGNLAISAISEKFGFSDQFYFSRRFKEKFGKSPLNYRNDRFIL